MTLEDEKRTFQLQVAEFSAVTRTDTRSQRHLERRSLPRRVFLGRLGAFAATVTALSVLPRNRALAYPPPYTTFPELNQYGAGGTCFVDAGCDGPSADFIDNGYCANCSDAAGGSNWYQWHLYGARSGTYYYDQDTNTCGHYGTKTDAWNHTASCPYCTTSARFRCHDGYKNNGSGPQWTICHGLAQCNGADVAHTCS